MSKDTYFVIGHGTSALSAIRNADFDPENETLAGMSFGTAWVYLKEDCPDAWAVVVEADSSDLNQDSAVTCFTMYGKGRFVLESFGQDGVWSSDNCGVPEPFDTHAAAELAGEDLIRLGEDWTAYNTRVRDVTIPCYEREQRVNT